MGFDAYKQAIDSGADLVILATPTHFRPMHYEYAVRQGKHVFMEKPLAVDAPGVRQILAANEEAKRKNLKVGVGLMHRHNLRIQETVRRLQEGAVGPVLLLRCYDLRQGRREAKPRKPGMSEMEYQLRNPYNFTWIMGDPLIDSMIHHMDVCCWLKGGHPLEAQGHGARLVSKHATEGDAFDHHFVEFVFADKGRMYVQLRVCPGCWTTSSIWVDGPSGQAEILRGRIEGAAAWRFSGSFVNPYQAEWDVLVDAIRTNQPHNEADYGAMSTMTAILGRMASYSGQVIRWEDAFRSQMRLAPERYALDVAPPVVPDNDGIYPAAMPGATQCL